MTDEQVLKIYEELKEQFGDKLPDPEHYPRTFEYFIRLYKHCKRNESNPNS